MTIRTNRRTFLQGAGIAVAASALTFRPGRARAATTLTLGHGAAPGNPRTVAAEAFAKMVGERTNGEVVINIAGSEQLGNDVSMLTSMRTGALDLTANSPPPPASSPRSPPSACRSFSRTQRRPIRCSKADRRSAGREVHCGRPDPARLVGQRHPPHHQREEVDRDAGGFFGMSIRTPADPVTVDIFQALGAATQQIPFGELYIALQQGVVDGQENPLANIASAKLFELNKFISLTGHQWQSTPS